jgi:hypothetical protein
MSEELINLRQDVNIFRQQEAIIHRKYDRQDISEEEYRQELANIKISIDNINLKIFVIMNLEKQKKENEDIIKKNIQEEELKLYKEEMKLWRKNKMVNEKVEKTEKVSKPGVKKGARKDSYSAYILDSLQKKSLNNVDKIVDYILEKKPGIERKNLKVMVTNIIKQVVDGKRPTYTWNAEEFMLTAKTQ